LRMQRYNFFLYLQTFFDFFFEKSIYNMIYHK
jgi:hypothetical protein